MFRLTDEKEYETLKNQITNILQECLTKAQTATTPPNRQTQNGEHKILDNNELKDIATETTTKGKRTKKEIKEV